MSARSQEEMDYMKTLQGACRYLGIDSEFISLDEVKQKVPIIDTAHLVGALWEEEGGHVDPARCHACLCGSRQETRRPNLQI